MFSPLQSFHPHMPLSEWTFQPSRLRVEEPHPTGWSPESDRLKVNLCALFLQPKTLENLKWP